MHKLIANYCNCFDFSRHAKLKVLHVAKCLACKVLGVMRPLYRLCCPSVVTLRSSELLCSTKILFFSKVCHLSLASTRLLLVVQKIPSQ